jgi:hypothetical protein
VGLTIIKAEMKKILGIITIISAIAMTGCFFPGPCIQGYGPVLVETRDLQGFTAVSNTGSFDVRITQSDSFLVEVEAQENLLSVLVTEVSGSTLIIKTKSGTCINSNVPVTVYVSLPSLESIDLSGSGKIIADRAESGQFECRNSGSGQASIDSIYAATATLKNTGSGRISVSGSEVEEMEIIQSGSGSIEAGTFLGPRHFEVHHSSSGRVNSTVVDGIEVEANLTGSGRIDLSGDAETATYSVSSSGKVDALDLIASDVTATITGSGKIYVYATEFLDATVTGSGDIYYLGNPVISTKITGSGSVKPY